MFYDKKHIGFTFGAESLDFIHDCFSVKVMVLCLKMLSCQVHKYLDREMIEIN